MLVDTHAHLDFEDFDSDRDEVVARAVDAGVRFILNPGINASTSRKAAGLAARYGSVYAAAGIHPNDTAKARPGDMDDIRRLVANERVVAVGETGLDFYRDRSPRDTQLGFFREHLDLAADTGLPIIVHFRNVGFEGLELAGLARFMEVRGVFHCFGGTAELAGRLAAMGFFIGFDGPLTYPGSDRPEVARELSIDRILVETDCPFLTPQSHRGKRNEPAYVAEVVSALAAAKGVDVGEVARATGRNACELFGFGG